MEIKSVSCFGERLKYSADGSGTEIVVSGHEPILSWCNDTDTTCTGHELERAGGFAGGVAIELDNGMTIMVGSRDGYEPMSVWLEKEGEDLPILMGDMARIKLSPRFEIIIPE